MKTLSRTDPAGIGSDGNHLLVQPAIATVIGQFYAGRNNSTVVHAIQRIDAVAPESYWLDATLMARPGNAEIQLDLKLDYASNVEMYPEFESFLRRLKLPTLAIWGRHDPFFILPGAEAFRRDVPGCVITFLDAGHFALETHADVIALAIREFAPMIPT